MPISGDALALRLVGSYDRRDSFGQNRLDSSGIGGDLNGGSIRGALLWRPAETIEVVLRGDYNKTSTSAQTWKARGIFTGAPGVATAATEVAVETQGASFLGALGTARSPGCAAASAPAACAAAFGTVGRGLASAAAAYVADGNTSSFWDLNNNVLPSHSRVKSYGGSGTITVDLSDTTQSSRSRPIVD